MRINLLDRLAKRGNTFTFEEVVETFNISRKTLWVILSRLEKQGWVERIGGLTSSEEHLRRIKFKALR